jgi:hypothetical protein
MSKLGFSAAVQDFSHLRERAGWRSHHPARTKTAYWSPELSGSGRGRARTQTGIYPNRALGRLRSDRCSRSEHSAMLRGHGHRDRWPDTWFELNAQFRLSNPSLRRAVCRHFLGDSRAVARAKPNPDTLAWFEQNPEAWKAATMDPAAPSLVMHRYAQWVRTLPWPRVFVAHPLTFDGFWIDWYLRRFVGLPLVAGFNKHEQLFFGAGLDMQSLIMGRLRIDYCACRRAAYPESWFGGHVHTHRAIDDAMGYASVLRHLLFASPSLPQVEAAPP